MTTARAAAVADAWVARLNAAQLGFTAARVFEVQDTLPERVALAVHVMPRADRGEPLTRESWLHRIEVATALRVRVANAMPATLDPHLRLAEQLADLAKGRGPLLTLDEMPVVLESFATTLWLPKELTDAGLFCAVCTHTWRVEVEN